MPREFVLAAILIGLSVGGCEAARQNEARRQEEAERRADAYGLGLSEPGATQFSKSEFSSHVYGLSKAEVRSQFGAPAAVQDCDDSWYYPNLPIYDPDAGIQVGVWIQFMGMDGPGDEVAAVRY